MTQRTDSPYPGSEKDSWPYFRREVMGKLEDLEKETKDQNRALAKLDKDLAVLQAKVILTSSALALVVSAAIEVAVKLFAH